MQGDILLVEDNPTDAEMTMRVLAKHDLAERVVWVDDGAKALAVLFEEGPEPGGSLTLPKLILLDLKLPKVDGIEVLRRLKADARTRGIPIVMLTSSAEERDIAETYSLGVNSYVVKPVDFAQFSEAVAKAGLYWMRVNKVPGS
jgi:two-component system response regulator